MKSFKLLPMAIMLSTVASGQTIVQHEETLNIELSAISTTEIATLRALAEAVDPALLGFRDAGEIDQISVGTPLRAYMIPLDRLQNFETASADPRSLLVDTREVTVPLLVETAPRSAITLAREENQWVAVSFGSAAYAKLMSTLRTEMAERDGRTEGSYFEVRVPALNLILLGTERDQALFLAPLLDDSRFDLTRGAMLPATELIERLQPAAREHNGLPT